MTKIFNVYLQNQHKPILLIIFLTLRCSMHIEKLYDKVANTYNQDVSGQVLNQAKKVAIDLAIQQRNQFSSILALGVGDGTDLLPYKQQFPKADLHGLDISENMLKKAAATLDCATYYGDIAKASSLIQKHDFDLIIAHFVTAYVPLPSILSECKKMLPKNGMVSIVTNTMSSFTNAQALLPKLENSSNPFNRLVAHHVKKALKTVYVPKNLNHLESMFSEEGFNLTVLKEEEIQIELNSEKDIYDFFINGGWFVSGLVHPLLPDGLLRKVSSQLVHRLFPIPYQDTMKIAIAIAEYKKP
jgi:trans-aconitate methyltransferase